MGCSNKIVEYTKKFNTLYSEYFGGSLFTKLCTLVDMVTAYFIYGSTITDYFEYEFSKKRHIAKQEFVTLRHAKKIFRAFNDDEYTHKFRDKYETNQEFDNFLGREWLSTRHCTKEEFVKFAQDNQPLIIKPRYGNLGRGVDKITFVNESAINDYYDEHIRDKDLILEQCIEQLDAMSRFHPTSVNSLRINTVVVRSEISIMSAALRIGNNGAYVDNHAAGGILASIDIATGVVITTGVDKFGKRYVTHPMTGEQIVGFVIPYWDAVKEFVCDLALVVQQVGYVGWDIALTKSGPVLIEGNEKGMFDVQQQAEQVGKRRLYKEVLRGV